MKKRGISGIVVTILLVLVSIVAVIIFWQLIKGLFEQDVELVIANLKISSASGFLDIEVRVKRGVGSGNLTKIKFVFENAKESYIETVDSDMKELEERNFSFNLNGKISNITKVSVAPVIRTRKGNEKTGGITDTYIFPVNCTPNCEGKECGGDGCEGSCGSCNGDEQCINYQCVSSAEPQINLELLYPTSDISVTRYDFFNFTVNVSCFQADCGGINVSLDPTSTDFVRPDGDSSPLDWSSTGVYHYTEINEVVKQPTIPNTDNYIDTSVENFEDTFDMGTLTVASVSQVAVWAYGEGRGDWSWENIYVDIYMGEAWLGTQNFLFTGTNAWKSTTFNGTWTQTDLNNLQIRVIQQSFEGNPATIYALYAVINYTSAVTTVTTKSGLISTTAGATPFYTNQSNPRPINLNVNQSEIVTFWVNATGNPGTYTGFFVYANKTSNPFISAITNKINVTII